MLACFFPFHLKMTFYNETTIEGPSPEFNVGVRRNMRQIFGKDERFWFLPIWASGPDGDGVHWPSPLVRRATPAAPTSARGSAAMEEGRLLASGGGAESEDSLSADGEA